MPFNVNAIHGFDVELVLDPNIYPKAVSFEYVAKPVSIFLTGATGFLGAFLLHELLHQTSANIYCLVRSPNIDKGKKRLQNKLKSFSLWDKTFCSRIIPVIGNLSQPLLGLSKQLFLYLANRIDIIYHNGAWVNHVFPYTLLKATNVLGTQEILRLASQTKVKPVHFISTLGVFLSPAYSKSKVIPESDPLLYTPEFNHGYCQSKWVAEKLVMMAYKRGIPVCIYRPGRITGCSRTGVSNAKDFFFALMKSWIQLGKVPDRNEMITMTPADYVSRAVVYLSRQKKNLGKTFHLFNPHPIHLRCLTNWIQSFGYPLEQVPDDEWQTTLIHFIKSSPNNALYPFLPIIRKQSSDSSQVNYDKKPHFDCQNTLLGLHNTNISCPPVTEKLLKTYFSYFSNTLAE